MRMVLKTTTTPVDGDATTTTESLNFTYDASGMPMSVKYGNTIYYYVVNIQGDIMAILNTSGEPVVQYNYDAWGKLLSTTGTLADTLGEVNPLTYRGYVYDHDSGYYYLQSRYYEPNIGRLINSDTYFSTGHGIKGNNMFAYCINNPTNMSDCLGKDAIYVVEYVWGEDGLPIVGHASLYIQDADGNWYFTEYGGPRKSEASVRFRSASNDPYLQKMLTGEPISGKEYVYISGDFSKSVVIAEKYRGSDYGGYWLPTNNCTDYVHEVFSGGDQGSILWSNYVENIDPLIPRVYYFLLVELNQLKQKHDTLISSLAGQGGGNVPWRGNTVILLK